MEPIMGEIKMFAGSFAPVGWFTCEGQRLPINQYTALFSILGTSYGGDGVTYFQLPDLRSAFPTQVSNIGGGRLTPYQLGEVGGNQQVTLSVQQMPAHSHPVLTIASAADQISPENNFLAIGVDSTTGAAENNFQDFVDTTLPQTYLNQKTIVPAGGSQPVNITPPFVAMQYIIAWQGVYPSRP
ncbi:phage tail protein [Mucilaginibacter sp. ZT4R22]|uniref:Phage tail protein n=1 Tax=Mucilaginibacter pankratovii TaxID=2772110 RepID=A0ABR7WJJ4_9SPHI|nr:tail fiber protein [Mucilaginibacter pankratovii]MBD1362331.1 phage tail protein [Mucilaginibacter pankratovii]